MQDITFALNVEQVKALLQITQNQLFRIRFLDPMMPGYKARPGELEGVESAVKTLEGALRKYKKVEHSGWTMAAHR